MTTQFIRYRSRIQNAQSLVELALLVCGAAEAGLYEVLYFDIQSAKARLA